MYYNNKRLALSIFWAVVGLVLTVLSVTEVLDSSIYSGMGGGLMAVGVLQAIRNVKYRKDADYREKIDVEANDERNRFLRMKSWSRRYRCDHSGRRNHSTDSFLLRLPHSGRLLGLLPDSQPEILNPRE